MEIHISGQPQTLKGASENRGPVHRLLQLRTYPWVNLNPPGAPNLTPTGRGAGGVELLGPSMEQALEWFWTLQQQAQPTGSAYLQRGWASLTQKWGS